MGRHEEALKILHGGTVIPAIPLVLDENRKFNEAGQRTLIRYYLDAGVGGLAVAVHTTQFEIRKPEVGLFEPVLRVTKEEMDAYEARTGKRWCAWRARVVKRSRRARRRARQRRWGSTRYC